MSTESKVAVITGASSGIGLGAARELASKGCRVYDFSRHAGPEVSGVTHVFCDVTKPETIDAALQNVLDQESRIDILISNAGMGISGAIEFTEPNAVRKQMEVNFFGTDNMCRAVVPIMRKQGSGRIVTISSVAAPIAIPFQAYYSASKAAIEDYTLALRNEVAPFGIEVVCILPGDIHTGFTDAREKSPVGDDVYSGRIARSVAGMEHDERTGMDPDKAGAIIAHHALRRHSSPLYTIGNAYKVFVFLTRIVSNRFLYSMVGKLYAK